VEALHEALVLEEAGGKVQALQGASSERCNLSNLGLPAGGVGSKRLPQTSLTTNLSYLQPLVECATRLEELVATWPHLESNTSSNLAPASEQSKPRHLARHAKHEVAALIIPRLLCMPCHHRPLSCMLSGRSSLLLLSFSMPPAFLSFSMPQSCLLHACSSLHAGGKTQFTAWL